MATNDYDQDRASSEDSRLPRRNSARLENDYRRYMRKATEERARRQADYPDAGRSGGRGQDATASRYREDYRERNASTRRDQAGPRQSASRDRDGQRRASGQQAQRNRRGQGAPRDASRQAGQGGSRGQQRRDGAYAGQREGRAGSASRGGARQQGETPRSRQAASAHARGSQGDRSRAQGSRSRTDRAADTRAYRGDARTPQRQGAEGGRGRQGGHATNPRGQGGAAARGRQNGTGSLISPRLLVGILLAIALVIAATMLVRFASAHLGQDDSTILPGIESQVTARVGAYKLPESQIVSRLEAQGVEDTWAQQAAQKAQSDTRFMVMAQRSEDLGREGSEVTNKIVKLAVSDQQAVDYVVDFIDEYPQESAQPYTDKVTKGVVPHIYQWDERWAFIEYSGTSFGCPGCGPTSMAMAYMAVTGRNDMSPADMAKLAADGGFETDYDGTLNQFFVSAAYDLGLNVTELDVTSDALTAALEAGMPVICNVGPGDFTLYGHFFVITGLNADGTVNINDPYSSVNSSESWDMDLILNQTVALYAYSEGDAHANDADEDADSSADAGAEEASDEEIA